MGSRLKVNFLYLVEAPIEWIPRAQVRVAADVMVLLVDDEGDVPAASTQRRLRSSTLQNQKEERCRCERLSVQWILCGWSAIPSPSEPVFEKRGCYVRSESATSCR
jgi:hypothetical protein